LEEEFKIKKSGNNGKEKNYWRALIRKKREQDKKMFFQKKTRLNLNEMKWEKYPEKIIWWS